ncbi:sulfatase [Pedobacter sp. BS3]|uniref:sulfatase n=1 Tax=Pedobacter sp. BS3 TaxID=2567937 RepID=UPI0011EF7460|nr:sulfatase [Pedobacter sp. BS3]TZF80920.1 sulfatase [Pedobacter sp. BS3]
MKRILLLPLLLFSVVAVAQRKPNIIYILADDMGWKDAGFTGSDFYQTPNLDAFAKQGMIFTDAYAGAGNCAPSRACLISGQYTPRHGVYAVTSTKRGPVAQMRLEPIPNTEELKPSMYTIAEAMHDAGYKTAMFGKWHLGKRPGTLPRDQGFDVDGSFNPPSKEEFERTNDPKGIYRITEGACKFMEENKDKPFFMYVAHHATHMMIQAREDRYAMFKGKAGKYQHNDKFAAMNNQMDDGIGILLKKIKDLGLEQNTVVIFTSDNGGLPQSPQNPLRGFKGMYYEGGIRVPFAVRWPGVIKPGSVQHTPIIDEDIFPTVLEIAQGTKPKDKILDGKSLIKLFKGEKDLEQRTLFWHFPGYLNNPNPGSRDQIFRSRPVSTIRKGDWKLLLYHEEWVLDGGRDKIAMNNAVELYHLKDDIGETKNLANINTAKRDEMLDELFRTMKQAGAEMPTQKNPLYKGSRTN